MMILHIKRSRGFLGRLICFHRYISISFTKIRNDNPFPCYKLYKCEKCGKEFSKVRYDIDEEKSISVENFKVLFAANSFDNSINKNNEVKNE